MQDSKPEIMEALSRVGITGLRTLVKTSWNGKEYKFIPEIELTLDLSKKRRGVHMSRLVESITESIEEEVEVKHESLEELERHILERVREKHPYKKAEILMKTQLVVDRETPATKKSTMETHDVFVSVISDNGKFRKRLKVKVVGNSGCPHALKKSDGISHVQRAECFLEVITDYENRIALEDMIVFVESAFPSEVYTLLKVEDEKYVVEKMFERPRFVEDITRDVLNKAKKKFKCCEIRVKTISQESIHRHDVVAEGFCRS